MTAPSTNRLIAVNLDTSIGDSPSPEAEHERRVAIFDLIEDNSFTLNNGMSGPFRLDLSTQGGRLIFEIYNSADEKIQIVGLSMTPFRPLVNDYFTLCESYYHAIRQATPSQIETLDMARRGLHNDGSSLLHDRLKAKFDFDFNTARRLFTLVCVLFWRG